MFHHLSSSASSSSSSDDDQCIGALVANPNPHRAPSGKADEESANATPDPAVVTHSTNEGMEPVEPTLDILSSAKFSSPPRENSTKKNASMTNTKEDSGPEEGSTQLQLTTSPDDFNDNKMATSENEEDQAEAEVPHDSFSMFYVAESMFEYTLPIGVFGLQILILVLILINLLQTDGRTLSTTMNVPVDVPLTVTISQYIACLVSVFTADDLISGFLNIGRRLIPKNYSHVDGAPPPISIKWEISNFMRIFEGALVICVSFIFIVQSATAIDLWLNFAGVAFVGFLDDTAFALAQIRFLGKRAKNLALHVTNIEVYISDQKSNGKKMRAARIILFTGITVALWAGLSVFVGQQDSLEYACKTITITAGESDVQYVRFFSGTYHILETKINQRAVYVQKQGKGAFLAYCDEDGINRWTITAMDADEVPQDPCEYYELQSERTRAYDITEIDSLQFYSGDSVATADIKCSDCNSKQGKGRSDCGWSGECIAETKSCLCDVDYFGDKCQFGPCTELTMHENFHGLDFGYDNSFDLLYLDSKPAMVYDRPVYVQKLSTSGVLGVILFDGGRWVSTQSNLFFEWNPSTGKAFAEYLVDDYNARSHQIIVGYISEPSSFGDPMGVPFKAILTDGANDLSIGKLGDEEFDLLCADCKLGDSYDTGISNCVNSDGAIDESICLSEESDLHGQVNRCNCPLGFEGPLCHIRPVEGEVVLHMSHGTGVCSVCGEGSTWTLWSLDGNTVTCLPLNSLVFEDASGTFFTRQVGIHLNSTHFSIFVSDNTESENLCKANDGTKEIHSIKRNLSNERIQIDYAIQLNRTRSFFGEIVDPEQIECPVMTDVEESICLSGDLSQVYGAASGKSLLEHAWILLDLKITPVK